MVSTFAFAKESNINANIEDSIVEMELKDGARQLLSPAWYGPAGKVILTLYNDQYPKEISWRLSKGSSEIARQKPNSVKVPYQVVQKTFSLSAGSYRFRITDYAGDGLCCAHGQGSWQLTDEYGDLIYASPGEFGNSEAIAFDLY
jgi:hypothetical protein